MLVHILDQHPDILCAGEIFKKKDTTRILHPEFSFDLPKQKETFAYKLRPNRIVRHHLEKCIRNQKESFGFKLMTSQIDACPSIEKALNRLDFKKIILIRENLAAQSLSLELARSSDRWINKGASYGKSEKVEIEIRALIKTIGYFKKSMQQLKDLHTDGETLLINYDQLTDHRVKCLKEICDFIGVESTFDHELSLNPSSSLSYEERISNFSEVERCLNNHGLKL